MLSHSRFGEFAPEGYRSPALQLTLLRNRSTAMKKIYVRPEAELFELPHCISLLEPTSAESGFEDITPGGSLNGDEPGLLD